jgi:cleavage and polyadenylation specificity factor subunit 2
MDTSYRFTPLYGVHGDQPLCYLLRMGDFTVLLDCGWDDAFDTEFLRPLESVAGEIDAGRPVCLQPACLLRPPPAGRAATTCRALLAGRPRSPAPPPLPARRMPTRALPPANGAVLLSHPDTRHLGALPYLIGRLGCTAPVYATLPVHKMGQMYCYDQFLSRSAASDFRAFDLDDVDAAFARVTPLRFQQTLSLAGAKKERAQRGGAAGTARRGAVRCCSAVWGRSAEQRSAVCCGWRRGRLRRVLVRAVARRSGRLQARALA